MIVRAGARLFVETRHGFQIMVHHVRRAGVEDVKRTIEAAAKIRRENFDLGFWRQRADGANAIDEMLRAAVAQIVAIDASNDHIFQAQCGDGFAEVARLVSVERFRAAVGHVAKRAAPRAQVPHDHECRRAFAEAFADVGARGFFADAMQIILAQNAFDLLEARAARGFHANPIGLFLRRTGNDFDRDARGFRSAGLLLADDGHDEFLKRKLSD